MSFNLAHSTLGRRVAMLFGAAAIATTGLAGGMAATASAEVPPSAYENQPWQYCRLTGADSHYKTHINELSQEEAEDAVWCLVNKERAAHGLRELTFNEQLRSAAERFANEAAETERWGNRDPEAIESRIAASGYCPNGTTEGQENVMSLAEPEKGAPAPPVDAFVAFADEKNILDPNMTETGVGVVVVPTPSRQPSAPRAWVVQEFGSCS